MPPTPKNTRYIRIPKRLDLDIKLSEYQMKDGTPIDTWKACLILNEIINAPARDKIQRNSFGYVNLYSSKLQRIDPEYRTIVNALVAANIIEQNPRYSTEKHFSKSYRLHKYNEWLGTERLLVPETSSIYKRLEPSQHEKKEMAKIRHRYPQITDSLSKLKIDYDGALEYLDQVRYAHSAMAEARDRSNYSTDLAMQTTRQSIDGIFDGNRICVIDKTSGRLHTNISNLKKEFRHFLKYEGEHLVGLDIRASQPYLAQMLFNETFWQPSLGGKRPPASGNSALPLLTVSAVLSRVDRVVRREVERMREKIPPMLFKIAANESQQGFYAYKELVNKHDIYQHIMENIPNVLASYPELKKTLNSRELGDSRDEAKRICILAMYCSNKPTNVLNKTCVKIYEALFPVQMSIFTSIKDNKTVGFSLLAILLQALESYIMLELVVRNIYKENPNIPVFTIHDSILTTPQHVETVKAIMVQEFTQAIGHPPGIKIEDYSFSALAEKPIPYMNDVYWSDID